MKKIVEGRGEDAGIFLPYPRTLVPITTPTIGTAVPYYLPPSTFVTLQFSNRFIFPKHSVDPEWKNRLCGGWLTLQVALANTKCRA